MFTVQSSVFIERPVQEVFEFVVDQPNGPRWQSGVKRAEWTTKGPTGKGSAWRSYIRFLGRDVESTLEYTDWDPPNQFVLNAVDGPVPIEGIGKFEARDGGTIYTFIATVESNGFFKLAEPLVRRQLDKQHQEDLSTLKTLLEAG